MNVEFHVLKPSRLFLTWVGIAMFGLLSISSKGVHGADDIRRDAVVQAVEVVIPSVVNISSEVIVESSDPFDRLFREFFDPHYRERPRNSQKSLGSGVIIDETGYLLTNFHVVRRGTRITVTLSDGREREARLLNATTKSDVALLKIIPEGNETFQAVPFAADDDLLLGETVIALGNPFGLGISVSRGILSSQTRRPSVEDMPLEVEDWLQTDAAINPGNSGGPLLNAKGELIGLNVAVFREGQGIGFAIPVKRVTEALSEIFTPEGVRSLWFGARFQTTGNEIVTKSVQRESPAQLAGMEEGDRVLRVNGQVPGNVVELFREILRTGRDAAELVVQRGNDTETIRVHMIPEKEFFTPELIKEKLGATVEPLDEDLARRFGLGRTPGLVIATVERGSPADRARLRPGYIVQAIDGQVPRDSVQTAKLLFSKKPGETVRLALVVPRSRGPFLELAQARAELNVR